MADKFGRHKSARWVRASVPSYGDEWNDDEYDYSSGSDSSNHVTSPDINNVVAERFVLPEHQLAPQTQKSPSGSPQKKPDEKLVLSIDKMQTEDSDSDDDHQSNHERPPSKMGLHDDNGTIKQTIISHPQPVDQNIGPDLEPPTPNFTSATVPAPYTPETPSSEQSFQSDADSIQNETALRVADHSRIGSSVDKASRLGDQDVIAEGQPAESKLEAEANAPLVLSIDGRNFENSDSETDQDDPIPYYEKRFDADAATETASENEQGNETFDSLIQDLQNASMVSSAGNGSGDREMLPPIDTNVSLPDFENEYSYYDYGYDDGDQSAEVTPIAPLATKDEQRIHQQYVQGLTGHKPSVRKPPMDVQIPASESLGPASDTETIEEEPSDHDTTEPDTTPTETEAPEYPDVKTPESRLPPQEQGGELHPVASSGSLSTGKLSFDQRGESFEPPSSEKDLNRRDSTMSTNTFSMGAWKPNTNNFRDRFIGDNDNESAFNFNMEDSNAGYQRFTKPRNVSDNMSMLSAPSIPETVDVALPSIHEDSDLDEEDEFQDNTFGSGTNTSDGSASNERGISNSSLLSSHEYNEGKFNEQMSSSDSVVKTKAQRYTSLLSPVADNEGQSNRSISESESTNSNTPSGDIDVSTVTISTRKTFPPNSYPVSNWKTMMKPSQPQDRIKLLKEALMKEYAYDTGLQTWLHETLTKSDNSSNMHIGEIASQAYQNAAHNDLRRHVSIRSRVSSVKDKVETGGLHASNLGKKFFSRSKKLMRST
ncbi:hypothetical protein CANTEDRAFT_119698 [Yamadazyma tenuis ATCC 10573]|uniref:Protein FYV8 n=1 Tax=Candida tenuis (strain ATCC 10573 / BCRC 21748 / CBS 615 / JCM 9827 / NBRC 10315 / NRRL Y-1498 / VKM Y-70) TaxID=590646 RepID=G3B0D8_CANTC|nr:uncharacterized protein CANTEDRAFT_119698 [Yamadazyma tenuis ATCC 10573]EGV65376.1 hypothetical protein CANTEDRAFT_119698 [Yamadazyma tenuis ATCC 10573]